MVKVGQTVRLAYLSQEVTELPASLRVLEAVEEVAKVVELGKGRQLTACQLLERFGFTGQRQWTRVGELSGGERRRLQLLRLLLTEPNVLMLDEPTNDLDIDTLTSLEDLLDSWPGVLLVVSHDRYLLERVADRPVALLGDGRLLELPGGVDEYLEPRRARYGPAAGPGARSAAPGEACRGRPRRAQGDVAARASDPEAGQGRAGAARQDGGLVERLRRRDGAGRAAQGAARRADSRRGGMDGAAPSRWVDTPTIPTCLLAT